MDNPSVILSVFLILLCILFFLIYILINKSEKLRRLEDALGKLKASFNELDEQAKIIVKTDLELNRAQEELDKRLNGLDALQKASRLISTTLDEGEIFQRLDESLMKDLDFEKSIILVFDKEKKLYNRVSRGVPHDHIKTILSNLENDPSIRIELEKGTTFSSAASSKEKRELIARLFNAEHFVLTPILTQNGILGAVFAGNQSTAAGITKGDEELISILANQIGQALENARLFEQVFRSSEALEGKVQERTKQLASALKDVQTISKTKTEFISAVSHELRTPLTSIKGYASILMTGKLGAVPDQVKARLEKINIHSDNLVGLINNLLDISRIESGRVEMKMTERKIIDIIENVHDLLTPQMREKNIQWVTDVNPDVPPVVLDIHQYERVFINLISNAIKFTPPQGTITAHAQFKPGKTEFDKGIVEMSIADTGIGICEDDMHRLFNEFFRVDNEINQNVKGTGLGLALAKKIVEAHKGQMWVTSVVGKGTAFHFTLPLLKMEQPVKQKTQTEE